MANNNAVDFPGHFADHLVIGEVAGGCREPPAHKRQSALAHRRFLPLTGFDVIASEAHHAWAINP